MGGCDGAHDGRDPDGSEDRRERGEPHGTGPRLRGPPHGQADDVPDDRACQPGGGPRWEARGSAGVQAPLPGPAAREDCAPAGRTPARPVQPRKVPGSGHPQVAGNALRARPQDVPGERHGPGVHAPGGRSAGREPLLRRRRLRRARRLQELLEEDPDPAADRFGGSPRPRVCRLRRRLCGDREREGSRRHCSWTGDG